MQTLLTENPVGIHAPSMEWLESSYIFTSKVNTYIYIHTHTHSWLQVLVSTPKLRERRKSLLEIMVTFIYYLWR